MTKNADPVRVTRMIEDGARMRTGRSLGRTLYLAAPDEEFVNDLCVGIVDSTRLAEEIVRRWNLVDDATPRGGMR